MPAKAPALFGARPTSTIQQGCCRPGRRMSADNSARAAGPGRLATGPAFALWEWFVYPPHARLGKYVAKVGNHDRDIEDVAVDFRMIHRVECEAVVNSTRVPVEAKVLELTVPAPHRTAGETLGVLRSHAS